MSNTVARQTESANRERSISSGCQMSPAYIQSRSWRCKNNQIKKPNKTALNSGGK